MFDNPIAAANEIKRLGLPSVFSALIEGTLANHVPDYVRREFGQPSFEIVPGLIDHVSGLAGLCPLWVQNGEAIVGRLPDGRFVRFYYEDGGLKDPNDGIQVLGKNYQQFVTSILEQMADAGLFEEEGQAVAEVLRYEHLPAPRNLLSDWSEEGGDSQLESFRDSLE